MADDPHRITLPDALKMVARARANPRPVTIKGWRFGAEIIRDILDQPGAAGLRAYHAENADGEATLVLVGTDAKGADLAEGVLAEWAFPCPPYCDDASPFSAP